MGAAEYMRRPIAPDRWRNLEKNSALLFIFKSIGCRFDGICDGLCAIENRKS
jgi:hypothetical protein